MFPSTSTWDYLASCENKAVSDMKSCKVLFLKKTYHFS